MRLTGQVGPSPARNHGAHGLGAPGCGGQRGRRAGARAEQTDRQAGRRRVPGHALDSGLQAARKQVGVEHSPAVGRLLFGEQVGQRRRKAGTAQSRRHLAVARAEAA